MILLVQDYQIVLYAMMHFILLIFGYISSHLAVIKQEERKQFDRKLWLYILLFFAFGSVVVFPLFDIGRYIFLKVWEGFAYVFTFIASKIGELLKFIEPIERERQEQESSPLGGGEQDNYDELGPSLMEIIGPIIYWSILTLIIGVICSLQSVFLKINSTK
ncbi:hypothetical protein ACFQ3N_10350 [Virgibacillus byunsanensis]|uniref:DUF4199 domain-containing protein n=1 Tax=Virgibacillus byunsanensis TaxID=570945 RepID=A0ABW3LLT3_9BACI